VEDGRSFSSHQITRFHDAEKSKYDYSGERVPPCPVVGAPHLVPPYRSGLSLLADNNHQEGVMIRSIRMTFFAASVIMLVSGAYAGTTLNAARIGAEDVEALAAFYKSAFGLKEVNRLQFPGMLEIMMNFGDTVEAAKKNPNAQIVIMPRPSDDLADPVPRMVLNVTDMKAAAEAINPQATDWN
jgi:hypothetical protein